MGYRGEASSWREQRDAVAQAFKASARREGRRAYRVLCPFCTSSKTGRADYSLSVDGATGTFYCHRCEAKGRLREAPDADLAAVLGGGPEVAEEVEPPDGFVPLGWEPGLSAQSFEEARAYAAKRGLGAQLCQQLQVGAVLDGYYGGRLVIPVTGAEREWRLWVARDWTGRAERKYLYPPGAPRGEVLFNEDVLGEVTADPVLVVEGVLDAVALWPEAVAVLGKPSRAQVAKLAAARRPVAVVLDGDAWREGEGLAMELALRGAVAGFVRLPPRTDPDEVDRAWLLDAARRSVAHG